MFNQFIKKPLQSPSIMETKISKSATSCTNTAAAPFELENQQDVQGDTSAQYLENFGRYLPGPSPSYLFKGWGPEVSRHGIAVCGCTLFLLSGYSQ